MKCGIIDVGSNSIRLSIYQWQGKEHKLLFSKKETAGLAGYVKNGVLSQEGIQVACRALSGGRSLLDNLEIEQLYAFATASLRNITNTEQAVDEIRRETGLEIQILSGAEEAALSLHGALAGGGSTAGLFTDIGGGSTELVSYQSERTVGGSLPIGSLHLYTAHVAELFPDREERKTIRGHIERELEQAGVKSAVYPRLTAVGGTARATARLLGIKSGILKAEDILQLYKRLRKADRDALDQILKICPERVHTILPGLMILRAIIQRYQVETVAVSTRGVRDGYLLDKVIQEG